MYSCRGVRGKLKNIYIYIFIEALLAKLKLWEGVYVWTHISTGYQYVGSSKNIRTRIGSYFKPSYHKGQLNRKESGTLAISRAMLKYPNLSFSPHPSFHFPSEAALTPSPLILSHSYINEWESRGEFLGMLNAPYLLRSRCASYAFF